jgi:hypothetical protein
MPKRLADFTRSDWQHLRPLTQGLKILRYNAINALYMRKRARGGDVAAVIRSITGRRALITVAFEDAQAIDWQIRLVRRYVACDLHLIADNSRDDVAAEEIRTASDSAGALYLRLPASTAQDSRSHALALNWLWTNVVRPGRPAMFGFLDDDFFPTGSDDPFDALASQDFFGVIRPAGERWFLWAGFCLFRYAAVADLALDFRQDWFIGLDTGGANWELLYRHADMARLRRAVMTQGPYRADVPESESYFQWYNRWLHEVGAAGKPDLKADKRAVVAAMLKPHLREFDQKNPR